MLGFSFDPQATGVTETDGVTVHADTAGFAQVAGERRMGRIPVLLVRMNVDLLMGEEMKKTGAGILFTVFGEPDIEITRNDDDSKVFVQATRTSARGPHSRPTLTLMPGRRSTRTHRGRSILRAPGKIAVKVINDYGDEVMKVFTVA